MIKAEPALIFSQGIMPGTYLAEDRHIKIPVEIILRVYLYNIRNIESLNNTA